MVGHRLYLFGGTTNGIDCCNDFYVLDTVRYTWYNLSSSNCPPARRSHAALALGRNIIIHGGVDCNGNNCDDAYIYNVGMPPRELQTTNQMSDWQWHGFVDND
jgi:N-acetylneuraminic acid mutarotase